MAGTYLLKTWEGGGSVLVAFLVVYDWGWDSEVTFDGGGSKHLFTSLYALMKDAGTDPSDNAPLHGPSYSLESKKVA